MPAITKPVQSYKTTFTSNVAGYGPHRAIMHLYEPANVKPIAEIRFYDASALAQYPNREDANGMPVVGMSLSELSAIVDTLRNEKPISMRWHSDDKYFYIFTDREDVGEGEA